MRTLLPSEEETITALSTAPGRSAIAVVRLSGREAFSITEKLVKPWPIPPRYASLCRVCDPTDGSFIDRAIVSAFPAPRSYTGEDTVEFSVHGGHAVSEAVIGALLKAGAREALPGEFTRRAVLNGKLDLIQAEAVGDLIDATSDSMRRLLLHQLDGNLSRRIDELRNKLLDLEALIAYDIDFPEEDHGPVSRERVSGTASEIHGILRGLLETAVTTEIVRDGAVTVIAGPPNVGKSSLFNALVGETRAIVTEIPGTTRDAIEARVQLKHWPLRLIDTAGLRPTDEPIELLGIEVSERYLRSAHLIVVCDDDWHRLSETAESIRSISSSPLLTVLTKADRDLKRFETPPSMLASSKSICVSAITREGFPALTERLEEILDTHYGAIPVARPAITRSRQRIAVETALQELTAFQAQWASKTLPAPVVAVHIRSAVDALNELIGAVDTEDVLGRVFATFCIGK